MCFAAAPHSPLKLTVRQKDKIMNPEIHSIVENMKRGRKESIATSDILVYQIGQMAYLLSLLAEEAEKATKWMVRLTWIIAILTCVLVLTIFFEFPKITIKTNQHPALITQETKKDIKSPKIQTLPNLIWGHYTSF